MPEDSHLPTWARLDKTKPRTLITTVAGIAVVVVVALLIGVGLTFLNKGQQAGGAPGGGGGGFGGGRRQPITVGTAKASIGQIPITLDALGTVTPPVTATITSRIAGNLMAVNFKEGQMVKKGQTLAQIDPRPYRVALEQAKATQAHDQALLADAQLDLKRYQTLLAQSSIASQQVDTQAALVKQDVAQVAADQAAVDNAKLNLDYTTITAPVDGRVGLRQVDVGNYIPAGSTTGLVVITVVNPMDVVFAIPEDNIPRITQRQQAGATLTATALNRDGGQELAEGALSTLDTQIDPTTGTVKAKARFDNSELTLFPQQFVNVHLLVDTLCNQIIVPTTAVRHGQQGDYVYTVQPDKTAKVQYVKTGPGTPETVSIVSGVAVGDVVITDGGDRLRDGSPVLLPGDNPQAYQQAQARFGQRGRGGQRGQHRPGGAGGRPGGHGQGRGPGQGPGGQPGAGAPPQASAPATTPGAAQQSRDLAAGSCDAAGGRRGPGGFMHGPGGRRGPGGPGGFPPGQGQGAGAPGGRYNHGPNGQGPNGQDQGQAGQGPGQGPRGQGRHGPGANGQGPGGQGPGGQGFHHRRGPDQGQGQGQGQSSSDGSAG